MLLGLFVASAFFVGGAHALHPSAETKPLMSDSGSEGVVGAGAGVDDAPSSPFTAVADHV